MNYKIVYSVGNGKKIVVVVHKPALHNNLQGSPEIKHVGKYKEKESKSHEHKHS